MKIWKISLYALILTALFSTVSFAKVVKGSSYYTKANIWYENPLRIFSTNYHVGEMLPVGTKVSILKINKKMIMFKDDDGTKYVIYYMQKYNGSDMNRYLDFYFSETNVLESEEYNAFSEGEKANIKHGILTEGMSKDAVLMAYGIPPSHRTSSTDAPVWTYWVNRFDTTILNFGEDGKIQTIIL